LAQHPWAVETLAGGHYISGKSLWLFDKILSAFVHCGLSREDSGTAVRLLWRYTMGELAVRMARDRLSGPPWRPADVDPDEMPILNALIDYWAESRTRDHYPKDLEVLVDWLITRRSGQV
jgi:Tetracyclin repressor-like, C-terminal domain